MRRLMSRMTRAAFCLALASALVSTASGPVGEARAQTRTETGRHRPRPVVPTAEDKPQPPARSSFPDDRGWTFGVAAGTLGAGRVFQAETVSGAAITWALGGGSPFQASRFNATFDQNFSMGLQLGKGLGRYLEAQAALGYASMNLGAEALAGQQGTVVLLDQVDVLTVGLGLVGKLVAAPSHPFVSAEALLTSLDPGSLRALEQTGMGWRLGLGFRQVFSDRWAARAQVRLGRTSLDLGDDFPNSILPDQPDVVVGSEDHLTFYEFIITVEVF